MVCFKVVPIQVKARSHRCFHLLKLWCTRRTISNCFFVVESVSFETSFQSWEQVKVTEGYVGTVRRLAKLHDTVFYWKWVHNDLWMRRCIIVLAKLVTVTKTVVVGILRSLSISHTINRRSFSTSSRTRLILSVVVVEGWLFLNLLCHSLFLVLPSHSPPKAMYIISAQVFLNLKQNFSQISRSDLSVKLSNEKVQQTQKIL